MERSVVHTMDKCEDFGVFRGDINNSMHVYTIIHICVDNSATFSWTTLPIIHAFVLVFGHVFVC